MPNQNKCDHVIGVYYGHFVGISSLDLKANYCPHCGAKIDWDKIKEGVDDK